MQQKQVYKGMDNLKLFVNAERASLYVAREIADLIKQRQRQGKQAVLGLATGNTPKRVYQELVRMHQNEGLSFRNVVSFNLDEYFPIQTEDIQSYTYFMNHFLFRHIDIEQRNIFIPHINCSGDEISAYCHSYDQKIISFGGIDLQLLGIGRNGHIGFNEPGSCFKDSTRVVNLHPITRQDALRDFGSIEKVPEMAVSMGIHNIIEAKRILLLALGEAKSNIIKDALLGEVSPDVPASILQSLSHVEFVLDQEAAALLNNQEVDSQQAVKL